MSNEKRQNSEKEQVVENIALLKHRFASLLQRTGTPIRDVLTQRFNARLGTLAVNPQQNMQQNQETAQQPQKQVRCPECGRWLPVDVAFCPGCGYPVARERESEKRLEKMSHLSVEEP